MTSDPLFVPRHTYRGWVDATQYAGLWFTRREVMLLRAITAGDSTKAIARTSGLTEKTIKNYLYRLYQKMGVPNRAAAAAFAVRHGIAE